MAASKSKTSSKKASKKSAVVASAAKRVAAATSGKKLATKVSARKTSAAVEAVESAKPALTKPAKKVAKRIAPAPKAAKAPTLTNGGGLTVGDTVPAFEAVDQNGAVVSSASLAGAPYVIYFYPKDDTPGCTTEACGFRDETAVFAERGVKLFGVSPDSQASHARFAQKYGLGFTLLADTEKKLVTAFGVWKLKQNYGREYWGVERSTFLVDSTGKIAKQWRGVKVAGHVPAVLEAVSQL